MIKAKPNKMMMDAERHREKVMTQKWERNWAALIVSKNSVQLNLIVMYTYSDGDDTHTSICCCFFGTMTITLRLKLEYMCKRWVDVESINTNPTHNFTPYTHQQHEWCVFNTFNMAQCRQTCVVHCSGFFRITFARLMCVFCTVYASIPAEMKRDQIKMLSNCRLHFNCFGYFISASIIFTHRFSPARFRCFSKQSAIPAISSAFFSLLFTTS